MTNLPLPSLIVINATNYLHHIPEQHMDIVTPDTLADFLNRILQNDIQVLEREKKRCAQSTKKSDAIPPISIN